MIINALKSAMHQMSNLNSSEIKRLDSIISYNNDQPSKFIDQDYNSEHIKQESKILSLIIQLEKRLSPI